MLMEMSSLQFGEFTINRQFRELRRQEAVLPVTGKAFDLLLYMASNPGRPLLKSELLDAVWPGTIVEESNLSQTVFLLRKILGSKGDGPIKTLPGRGYQFVAEVSEIELAPPPGIRPPRMEASASLTIEATETRVVVSHDIEEHHTWRAPRIQFIVAAALLAVVAVLGSIWRQRWLDRTGGPPVQVVLSPLEGTTGDPVLDKSLTQALRMDLAQSPYVTVVPGSTVMARLVEMQHKPDDPMSPATAREVCERTNSQGVLSGNIAKVGQHYLITEEASNCVDGSVLGQAKYEAATVEDLPHAIDKTAANLRRKLRRVAPQHRPLQHATLSRQHSVAGGIEGVYAGHAAYPGRKDGAGRRVA